jgi:hypothetical protein
VNDFEIALSALGRLYVQALDSGDLDLAARAEASTKAR